MLLNQLKVFISSTIGKKMVVATTGLLFCLFLLAHLANNFVIYTGAENFNFLVKSLEKIKPLIRLAEVMLVLILGGHIYNLNSIIYSPIIPLYGPLSINNPTFISMNVCKFQ